MSEKSWFSTKITVPMDSSHQVKLNSLKEEIKPMFTSKIPSKSKENVGSEKGTVAKKATKATSKKAAAKGKAVVKEVDELPVTKKGKTAKKTTKKAAAKGKATEELPVTKKGKAKKAAAKEKATEELPVTKKGKAKKAAAKGKAVEELPVTKKGKTTKKTSKKGASKKKAASEKKVVSVSDVEEVSVKRVKKASPNTTKTVRLELTEDQKKVLVGWLGTCRWTYNRGVDSGLRDKQELLDEFVTNRAYEDGLVCKNGKLVQVIATNTWVLNTPNHIRQHAIFDLVKAIKTNSKKVQDGKISHFKMEHRTKKDKQDSFVLLGEEYEKVVTKDSTGKVVEEGFTYFSTFFEKAGASPLIKARDELPEKLDHDSRIVRTRLGEWYLKFPTKVVEADVLDGDSQVPVQRICALDPGLRTFQTIYDLNGSVIEVGAEDRTRLFRLCLAADDLISRRSKVTGRKKYTYRRAYLRIFRKIGRLVDEVHHKLARFLILNYNIIYLPSFDTQSMLNTSTSKGLRKINSKSAKILTAWSHYKFKTRLLYKAGLVSHCKVIICDESYTSKTCTCCGHLNDKLGASKVFKCRSCKMEMDRDFNGARNILIKNLVKTKC